MKILYISCHQVLEYDEVKLLHELGYDVFSTGTYAYPKYRDGMIRPGIDTLPHYPELERLASTIVSNGYAIPQELIDWADTIIFMHLPEAIEKNWAKLKQKRVIFRSIGQCVPHQERFLGPLRRQGLEVIRYSPLEENIPDYCGKDGLIRFYKDPEEFKGYTGDNKTIINFTQSMLQRKNFVHSAEILQLIRGFNAKVYGTGNEDLGELSGGVVSYDEMKQLMRINRAFIYTGTWPASYTLAFMEAMMTGIPIVAVGRAVAESDQFEKFHFYEIPDIIQDGENGFVSDNIDHLRQRLDILMHDLEYARRIGAKGRETAIRYFGKDTIKNDWLHYLSK